MRAKSMIIGLVLLLVGGVVLLWNLNKIQGEQEEIIRYQSMYSTETDDYIKQYNEWLLLPADERTSFPLLLDKEGKAKTRTQLKREQRERLMADLDKLASGQTEVHPLADVLYGENWPVELQAYKKRKELNKRVLIGSIVCTSMGGLVYVWWLLFWVARMIGSGLASLKQRMADSKAESFDTVNEETEADTETKTDTDMEADTDMETDMETEANAETDTETDTLDPEDLSSEPESPPQHNQDRKHTKILLGSNWGKWKPVQREPEVETEANQIKRISNEVERIASLLSDEKNAQVEALMTKPLNARDHAKPIDNTLIQLSQEVSAIREYTSYQQDRLEKLQDGYDWNIIRTFCLRVIRCIDNIDNRVSQLNNKGTKTAHLTEVRDELIFALESSGVEQFEPEIHSDYRGQEKVAEAVKDRQPSEKPDQRGKIACIIRPGYQYFISEENIKIVRPAQVRLFA